MDTESDINTDNKYLLEVKTVQSSAFRILVEALKEILTDANLEFDETGMKVMAMDSSHTVLVHLKLQADKFCTYHCKNKFLYEKYHNCSCYKKKKRQASKYSAGFYLKTP